MICNTCDKKAICKHYDYIVKTTDVNIIVDSCNHKSMSLNGLTTAHHDFSKTIKPNPYVEPEIALLNNKTTSVDKPNVIATKPLSRNFRELSNKVNKDRVSDSFKVTSTPTALVKCDNPECQADTYEEDKTVCSVCGKAVCPVCSYTDIQELNSLTGEDNLETNKTFKTICEECHKASDVVPEPVKKKRGRPKKAQKAPAHPFGINVFGEEE